nr:imidazole glycerol phosphate synthase subunit HisH [Marinicella sp. W31]MDC2879360.1 imidazole glycerol phosphate synthase subunit HisH [Marinicella sp. W31]
MKVAIIDYGSGNLRSATKAFERAAREQGLDAEIILTDKAEIVASADRIVLPGVGAYADCRAGLHAVPGMVDAIRETVENKARPFLGICVGMQLMSERGLEKTVSEGFGWIAGDVTEITPEDRDLKIPQIGWNTLELKSEHWLFDGIPTGENGLHAYFVHSYHLAANKPEQVIATTGYGGPVTAFVADGNKAGSQFHPEKARPSASS